LVFRVTQEALSNVAKHSRASRVDVSLHARAGGIVLSIRDDGCGGDAVAALESASAGHSSGLGGMRDRVRLFGGVFRVESKEGDGFMVLAQFPSSDAAGKLSP
jgi:two-component system NarL family sensor kinase